MMIGSVAATGFSPSSHTFDLEKGEEGCERIQIFSDSERIEVSDKWAENVDVEWKVNLFDTEASSLVIRWDGVKGPAGGGSSIPDLPRRFLANVFNLDNVRNSKFLQTTSNITADNIYKGNNTTENCQFNDVIDCSALVFKNVKNSRFEGYFQNNLQTFESCIGVVKGIVEGSAICGTI